MVFELINPTKGNWCAGAVELELGLGLEPELELDLVNESVGLVGTPTCFKFNFSFIAAKFPVGTVFTEGREKKLELELELELEFEVEYGA